MKTSIVLALVCTLQLVPPGLAAQSKALPTVNQVVTRAADYVKLYELQFGSLIGDFDESRRSHPGPAGVQRRFTA